MDGCVDTVDEGIGNEGCVKRGRFGGCCGLKIDRKGTQYWITNIGSTFHSDGVHFGYNCRSSIVIVKYACGWV